jgi:hypothetical protein
MNYLNNAMSKTFISMSSTCADFLQIAMSRTWIFMSEMLHACPGHGCAIPKYYVTNIGEAVETYTTQQVKN